METESHSTADTLSNSQGPCGACDPFNDPDADTILRTSDRVDFRVYKLVLSLASPVFKAMLKTREPYPANADVLPVFDVPEDARTIAYILRCCYPLPSPSMTALQDLRPILYAAQKYGIAAVTSLAKVSLEHCIPQDILGVFAIASRCELNDVCVNAATQSLQHKLTSLDSEHLDQISARQLHKLLQYHSRHRADASASASTVAWCSEDSRVSTPHWMLPCLRPSDQPIRLATAPFCEKNADITLRSPCPPTDFHVHKVILSLASPIFRDMFELAQVDSSILASSLTDEARPIVNVTEDAHTLELILRCIYPVQLPIVEGLDRVRLFLEAGRKYDIEVVSALTKSALVKCIDEDVLGTFAIAFRYDLLDVCAMVVQASLKTPLMSLDSTELDHIPANTYHKLLQYHERCREAASQVIASRTWFTEDILDITRTPNRYAYGSYNYDYCSGCQILDPFSRDRSWRAPQELWDYLEHAGKILDGRPHYSMVLSEEALAKWVSSAIFTCQRSDCRRIYIRDVFSRALAKEVEKAVAEVQIPSFA